MPTKERYIKDPIHGLISISLRGWTFIDTKQFQRLRHLKQLGTSYNVWPGASHNRFEHCLGVGYLARLMIEHIQSTQPELGLSKRDVECVELAGLCHDLGHGPWSHVWDGQFMPRVKPEENWKHEKGSEDMLDHLIDENGIEISEEDRLFIKALISGDSQRCPGEQQFLFDIVSNKRNGLDVDRFDYILRDSYMTGDAIHLNLSRIIKSARVNDNQICYHIKDANQIYEICASRFKLHKMIYSHKTARAIEYMLVDALAAADPILKLSDRVFDPAKYVYLTDHIQTEIEQSEDPGLAFSRKIFEQIRTRDLYRMVDWIMIPWKDRQTFKKGVTPKSIVDAVRDLRDKPGANIPGQLKNADDEIVDIEDLKESHIIVDLSPMHYGMQEKNPLDEVRWYSDSDLNKCQKAGPGQYSTIMPEIHAEVLTRVYTRDPVFFGVIQAGFGHVMKSLNLASPQPQAQIPPYLNDEVDEDPRKTPPVLHRSIGRNASISSMTDSDTAESHKPYSLNSFTMVAPEHVPPSPRKNLKKRKGPGADSMESLPNHTDTEGPGSPCPKKRKGNQVHSDITALM